MRRMRQVLCLISCMLLLFTVAHGEFVFVDTDDEETTMLAAAETPAPSPTEAPAAVEVLITAAGDVTLGGNMKKNPSSNIYTKALEAKGGDLSYFFANVYDIFAEDDMTLVNFEGVLTDNVTAPYKPNNEFAFRAPTAHVNVLTQSSVEAVALENNHVMDFGPDGLLETKATLTAYGIVYSSEDEMGLYATEDGVTIGMLSYQTFNGAYPRLLEKVPLDIAKAKAIADIVIVSYHWGEELDYAPHDNQITLGRATIDGGADLVLGHHSHRINPIEEYNGKYIVYSLANCSFSGNSQPSDMDTFLFQTKFLVEDGVPTPNGFRIIPASISSITGLSGKKSGENDFAVTPFEPGSDAAQRVIDNMLTNGKKLEYGVTEYPTEWE